MAPLSNKDRRTIFQNRLNDLAATTNTIAERLDQQNDYRERHKDTVQALCTLTEAVLTLAEIQLYRLPPTPHTQGDNPHVRQKTDL